MKTSLIVPSREHRLNHRAYHIRTSGSGHLVAASDDGVVSVFGPAQDLIGSFNLKGRLRAISLRPDGGLLAAATDSGVHLVDLQGKTLERITLGATDAWFDAQARLWLAENGETPDRFRVQVFEPGEVENPIMQIECDDPFGESHLRFPDQPLSGQIPLWVAAGQDGQVVVWLEMRSDAPISDTLDDFEECGPVAVSPSQEDFLLPVGDRIVRRYDLLTMELTGEVELPIDEHELITSVVYLDDAEALATTEESGVYRIDSQSMSVVELVEVQGHERRPTRELYPTLSDEDLTSDLIGVYSPGCGSLVSVHSVLPDPRFLQHSSVVWW